jgi:hypothetical protein
MPFPASGLLSDISSVRKSGSGVNFENQSEPGPAFSQRPVLSDGKLFSTLHLHSLCLRLLFSVTG